MYSADPVQPRPNLIRDAVPTPRPTPYLWTGLGWTNFGDLFVDEHLHTLCVWAVRPTMPPPGLWGLPCRKRATWLHAEQCTPEGAPHMACRLVIRTRQSPKTGRPMAIHPSVLPIPKGRKAPTRGERR
jgi:hypothetical protein